MSLDPLWDRVLEKDRVTLQCRGAYPQEDNSTRWFHNGNLLPGQASSFVIADARVNNSGNYSCQTGSFTLSDPVHLKVHAGERAKGMRVRLEARRGVGRARDEARCSERSQMVCGRSGLYPSCSPSHTGPGTCQSLARNRHTPALMLVSRSNIQRLQPAWWWCLKVRA